MKRLFSILLLIIILSSSMGCGYKATIAELEDDIAALDGQVISLETQKTDTIGRNKELKTHIKAFEEENSKLEEDKLAREATVKELEDAVETANDKGLGVTAENIISNLYYLQETSNTPESIVVNPVPTIGVNNDNDTIMIYPLFTTKNNENILSFVYTMASDNIHLEKIDLVYEESLENDKIQEEYFCHMAASVISFVMARQNQSIYTESAKKVVDQLFKENRAYNGTVVFDVAFNGSEQIAYIEYSKK